MFISIVNFTKPAKNSWMHEINIELRDKFTGSIVEELNTSKGFVSREATITDTILTVVTIFETEEYYYDFLKNRTHVIEPYLAERNELFRQQNIIEHPPIRFSC